MLFLATLRKRNSSKMLSGQNDRHKILCNVYFPVAFSYKKVRLFFILIQKLSKILRDKCYF